jgi:hypothetical protein
MKSVLFVRGFATALSTGVDIYLHIKTVVNKTHDFVYFDYDPSEALDVVYKRMCSVLESRKFDILMGHSLGGGLLAKYFKSNPSQVSKYEKIILLMPFMCKNIKADLLTQLFASPLFTFNPDFLLQKALLCSSSDLLEGGNLLNDDYSLVSFKQPSDLYTEPNSAVSNDISFIVNNPNMTIFYASEEKINIIDESVLQKIPKAQLKRVSGLHECWRSIRINADTSMDFFTQMSLVLEQ